LILKQKANLFFYWFKKLILEKADTSKVSRATTDLSWKRSLVGKAGVDVFYGFTMQFLLGTLKG